MRDRTPTKVLDNGALRYGVYDESGSFLRHEYLVLDDEPTNDGTVLSKATLLKDATETDIFGGSNDRTVDDALMKISQKLNANISDVDDLRRLVSLIMNDVASITLTVKDSSGKPIQGVSVTGVLTESGQPAYSNESGVISGVISEGSQTISVKGYADIEDYSETISVVKGESITKVIVLNTRNFLKILSTQNVKFSGNVNTLDVTVVGGGGGGAAGSYGYPNGLAQQACGGGGGGGGYCVVKTSVNFAANTPYSAIIGEGGALSSNGNGGDGGASSFLGIIANGGKGGLMYGKPVYSADGGAGNGAGGSGVIEGVGKTGGNGDTYGYSSFTATVRYGGGGGAGDAINTYGGGFTAGGADYGAEGGGVDLDLPSGSADHRKGVSAVANTGGGGGGGYAFYSINDDGDSYDRFAGGAGGSGCVAIRMHLKSAS